MVIGIVQYFVSIGNFVYNLQEYMYTAYTCSNNVRDHMAQSVKA